MKPCVVIRPGDMPPDKVKRVVAVAEGLGFKATIAKTPGRKPVTERIAPHQLEDVRQEITAGRLSLRQGARRLGIGASTLYRLLSSK